MSQLIRKAESGSPETYLDEDELRAVAGLVLAAGFETTVNLLGNGIRLLLDNPGHLHTLSQRPELWPNAVEEILRLESPVQLTARLALNDTEIAGMPVGQGELVVVYVAAANRDPAVFGDPNRFDIERENAGRHLAFSGGRHFCLGAALARAEGEVGLRAFFDRFPEVRSAVPAVVATPGFCTAGRRCRLRWARRGRWLTASPSAEIALQRHGADQLAVAVEHGALGQSATADAAGRMLFVEKPIR